MRSQSAEHSSRWDARAAVIVTILGATVCCFAQTNSSDAHSSETNSAEAIVAPPDKVVQSAAATALDRGFAGLYNLDFDGAQKEFSAWQTEHSDDPVGAVSEAAGFLFSEFNRLGVLEGQFYENDKTFVERRQLTADPDVRARFQASIERAKTLARARLAKDPRDRDALFAMTLASGLQADFAALIEKKNMESLHYTKDATNWAKQLLAECPDCYDALLAGGFSKYIMANLFAPVRWMVRMDGLSADKKGGLAELEETAQHGRYLAPFARILLSIAYVREKDKARALELLTELHHDFPGNTLFPREIERLQGATAAGN